MISARRWFPATAVVVTVSLSSRHSSSYSYSYDICQLYWQDHSSSCSWHLDGSVLSLSEDSDEVVIIGETSAGFLWRCLRVVWIMFNEWLAFLSFTVTLSHFTMCNKHGKHWICQRGVNLTSPCSLCKVNQEQTIRSGQTHLQNSRQFVEMAVSAQQWHWTVYIVNV